VLPLPADAVADIAEPMMEHFSTGEYPHLVAMSADPVLRPGYDFGNEFEFGLARFLPGGEATRP
jgi:hypothetical protein